MSVVAPITVAWQGIVDSVKNEPKEIETFDDLEEATNRAREVTEAAKNLNNNDYVGSSPQAHITLHPGNYQFKDSIEENLNDIYITILPGATIEDLLESVSSEKAKNIADLNSFAETAFFSESQDRFSFESPVRFKDQVTFQENTFPVKRVEGGVGIRTSSSFGDVTVKHGRTGGASDNQDEDTFLNKIQFDNEGHVENANFGKFERGVEIENNSSDVLNLTNTLNFSDNISATSTPDEKAVIKIPGTENFEVSDFQNFLPIGERLSKISGTNGEEAKLADPPQGYSKNEVFPTGTETEKGVIGPQQVFVSGKLNPQVKSAGSHDAETFSEASYGSLKLVLNGTNLVTLDLSKQSSRTSTSQSGASKLSVSETAPLSFPNEETYPEVTQRTGTWEVGQADMQIGLNTIKVVHEGSNKVIGESQEIKYYLENSSFNRSISTPSFSVDSLSDVKYLSGVKYNTGGSINFTAIANNVYQNVYSKDKAIKYPISEELELPPEQIPELGPDEDKTSQLVIEKTLDIASDRVLEIGPKAQVKIEDPVEDSVVSSVGEDLQLLIDQVDQPNEDTVHHFNSENLRIDPNRNFDLDVSSGTYDSTKSIRDDGYYSGQLQVTDGKLIYPYVNYSQVTNGPSGNPDYSSNLTGQRTYYGFFTSEKAVSNFVLSIDGSGEITSPGTISANNDSVAIAIKVPTETGWLDINKPFTIGCYENGDGAYLETNAKDPNFTMGPNSEIGLTIGKKNTSKGYNKLYFRVLAPDNWTGEIRKMSITWGTK